MILRRNKILDIFYMLILREKFAWTLACICCTGLLCYEILMDFFIGKPTVSSVEEINLSEINFPDVLVCVQNGFSKENLKRFGYGDGFLYYVGQNKLTHFIGWNGLHNEDPFRNYSDN